MQGLYAMSCQPDDDDALTLDHNCIVHYTRSCQPDDDANTVIHNCIIHCMMSCQPDEDDANTNS